MHDWKNDLYKSEHEKRQDRKAELTARVLFASIDSRRVEA